MPFPARGPDGKPQLAARLLDQPTLLPGILEDVAANPTTGGGQFDFSWGPSGHGTFVYMAGKNTAQAWQVALA
jgi:hypothetical protein